MRIPIKPYVGWLYLGALVWFIANKFVLRPLAADRSLPALIETVLASSPNAAEGVIGMTNVALVLLLLRRRFERGWGWATNGRLYALTAALAGTFVLTQEFKLHHLGGRNVYDPADAVASALSVAVMWLLFSRFDVLKAPRPAADSSSARRAGSQS